MKDQFNFNTDSKSIPAWLETLYERKDRIRVWYGDVKTGRSWNDEHDVIGTISKSTGKSPIYILVNNARSFGGSGLLNDCIIRIDLIETKQTVYKHKKFYVDLKNTVLFNAQLNMFEVFDTKMEVYARFDTKQKAFNYLKFMRGERYAK